MNAGKDVLDSEHIALAEAKQRTQTRVCPQVTSCQITHPQAQLTRAGGEFHKFLAFAQFAFGPPSPRTLQKQTSDQHGFDRDDGERAGDVPMVLLPKRRLAKPNDATGRKTGFANTPAAQLAPVVKRRRSSNRFCWDARRNFAPENAQRNASRFDADVLVR